MSTGRDGKLYDLLEEREWNRYRIVSDQESREELLRSKEIKQNMMVLTGKIRDGRHVSSSGIKYSAPQLGTSSRSKRIEHRTWNQEMTQAASGKIPLNSSFGGTISQLAQNTKIEGDTESEEPTSPQYNYTQYETNNPKKKVKQAFNVVKQKYEQNLHVIDKLYDDKISLEDYVQSLESELMRTKGIDDPEELKKSIKKSRRHAVDDDNESEEREYQPPKRLDASISLSDQRPPRAPSSKKNTEELSAYELAELLNSSSPEAQRGRGRSLRHSEPVPVSFRSHSEPRGIKSRPSSSASPARSLSNSRPQTSSMTPTRRRVCGVSPNLQADADRYVQKRRLFEERERLVKLEQEEYERQQRDRFLKASLYGSGFKDMEKREAEYRKHMEERLQKKKEKETNEKIKQRKQKELEKQEKERLKASLNSSKTWKELHQEQEQARQERIKINIAALEQSKEQLPPNLMKSIEDFQHKRLAPQNSSKSLTKETNNKPTTSHLDPHEIVAKLNEQAENFKLKLRESKEKMKLKQQEHIVNVSTQAIGIESMLQRNQEYQEKRIIKQKEKEEREKYLLQLEKEKEKAKYDALLATKLPEGSKKMTKAVEKKLKQLDEQRHQELLQKEKEERLKKKKEREQKEASAVLKVIMRERDEELKALNPQMMELTLSEKLSEERARQAREEYRQKLRDNKRKIEESLKARPSLLERHNKSIAKRDAGMNALQKIAQVVKESNPWDLSDDQDSDEEDSKAKHSKPSSRKDSKASTTNKSTANADDIFDDKEKLLLGIH